MRKDDAKRLGAALLRVIFLQLTAMRKDDATGVPLFLRGIFIQLTALRKDDAKRLGAAVIKGNFYSTHRHEKRRRQAPGCRCHRIESSPPAHPSGCLGSSYAGSD
jgi:hypothetical protein